MLHVRLSKGSHVASAPRSAAPARARERTRGVAPMTVGAPLRVERLHRDRIFAGAECALSLILGFITVGSKSLWNDEAYSATVASGSWRSLYQSWRERDANMSLYHVLLHVWRDLASSEVFLRSLSIVATAASVAVVFAIGRRLFNPGTGLLAGLVIAVAPFGVEYSQQVRSYALTMMLVALSTYFFVVGVDTERRGAWLGYVVCSVLAVYADFFAALVLVAHAASLPVLRRELRPVRQLAISGVAIVLLLLPGVLLAATGPRDQLSWLARPGVKAAFGQPMHLAGGPLLALIFIPPLVAGAVYGWRVWRAHGPSRESWHVSVVFSWLLAPYAALPHLLGARRVRLSRSISARLPSCPEPRGGARPRTTAKTRGPSPRRSRSPRCRSSMWSTGTASRRGRTGEVPRHTSSGIRRRPTASCSADTALASSTTCSSATGPTHRCPWSQMILGRWASTAGPRICRRRSRHASGSLAKATTPIDDGARVTTILRAAPALPAPASRGCASPRTTYDRPAMTTGLWARSAASTRRSDVRELAPSPSSPRDSSHDFRTPSRASRDATDARLARYRR